MTDIPPGAGRSPIARGMAFAVSVLLASAAAGFWVYRLNHQASTYEPSAGAAPQPADVPAAGRKLPERIPPLSLPGVSGKQRNLSEWAGRPLMVNFWATWCEPCQREIPLLNSLRREHAGNGLEIVGIAIDSAESVAKYASDHSMGYPILIGERGGLAAAAAFGMDTVLPFTVFADAQGRVVGVRIGELHRDEAELILGLVNRVDENKVTLEAARREISASLPRLSAARAATGDSATQ